MVKVKGTEVTGATATLFWKTEYPTAVHVGGQLPLSVVTSTLYVPATTLREHVYACDPNVVHLGSSVGLSPNVVLVPLAVTSSAVTSDVICWGERRLDDPLRSPTSTLIAIAPGVAVAVGAGTVVDDEPLLQEASITAAPSVVRSFAMFDGIKAVLSRLI
jgi:hypothetical protein